LTLAAARRAGSCCHEAIISRDQTVGDARLGSPAHGLSAPLVPVATRSGHRQRDHMPAGFRLLIAAQFASALADNALLIVTIGVLQVQGLPGWWAPMLKFGFTISYVLLAPFVGPLADAFPKARLMAWMNGVKVVGVMSLLLGAHPVLAFAIVGFGAAAYAPAKYGLITELVAAERLVAANGWLEVSVVCAALIGTVFGGLLVSPWVLESAPTLWLRQAVEATAVIDAIALHVSLLGLLSVYALAGGLNLGVPDSGAR
jgi:hypothetical protein